MRLTIGEQDALELMEGGKELVRAIPGGWWIGIHQVAGQVGWALLTKTLIREAHRSLQEDYYIYRINERGRHVSNNR